MVGKIASPGEVEAQVQFPAPPLPPPRGGRMVGKIASPGEVEW